MVVAAAKTGIQVIWDIFHYGWPDDLDILSPAFVDRFARYAAAVARHIRDTTPGPLLVTPVNEISFFSWAAGEVGWFHPYERGRGLEVKRQLVRSAIAGINAIWEVDPAARIVHSDPIIHVVAPRGRPDLLPLATRQRESQFEAWDMLCGVMEPELGGHIRYLDVIGVCFYHSNQWEYPSSRLRWEDSPRDSRWLPLHALLVEVYERYKRPLCIAETSHFGIGRGPWLEEIAREVRTALEVGVAVEGVCLYPVLDRPDWDDELHWHNSGLWDLTREGTSLRRSLNTVYADAFRGSQ
jgi:hypothetical protein